MAPGKYSTDAQQHTLQPIVTGATVVGLKYKDGVLLAADTLALETEMEQLEAAGPGSYGNDARYKDVQGGSVQRTGAGGEYSDFQYLSDQLDELADEETRPKEYSSYIGRVMYNRRSKCLAQSERIGQQRTDLGAVSVELCCVDRSEWRKQPNEMNPLYNQFIVVGKKKENSKSAVM
eukprot:Skav225403  [mRNA]  locus=scaffold2656:469360:473414:+ [translate_table: standard]